MRKYKNPASGVVAYEIAPHFIDVKFKGGATYRYDETNPGKAHVEQMKRLAREGAGLATYISQYVEKHYVAKFTSDPK